MKIDNFRGPYWFLSNFCATPIVYGGHEYKTVEHAFQAAKATIEENRRFVADAPTPGIAKQRGRSLPRRPDWDEVKVGIMLECLRAKFVHGSKLGRALVVTGDAHLEEGNNWGDRFWGTVAGQGQNWLGRLLMQVRDELCAKELDAIRAVT